jgi:hypothetical protein
MFSPNNIREILFKKPMANFTNKRKTDIHKELPTSLKKNNVSKKGCRNLICNNRLNQPPADQAADFLTQEMLYSIEKGRPPKTLPGVDRCNEPSIRCLFPLYFTKKNFANTVDMAHHMIGLLVTSKTVNSTLILSGIFPQLPLLTFLCCDTRQHTWPHFISHLH